MKYFVCALALMSLLAHGSKTPSKIEDLKAWRFLGEGSVSVDKKQSALRMSETPGSKGVMIVSNKKFKAGKTFKYKIKPENSSSVAVNLYQLRDNKFPENYDGKMGYIVKNKDTYFMPFHNKAHRNLKPLIRKFPQELPGRKNLTIAKENVTKLDWNTVEVGSSKTHVWMKINGEKVVEAKLTKGLVDSYFSIRLRGTKKQTASVLIKEFTHY